MEIGKMFGYEIVAFLWILIVMLTTARHVPVPSQRSNAQSRTRLLVIRPPEGSGRRNRIVVLTNPRPEPTNPSPPSLSTAISALQETAAVAEANLNRAFGGHPQSAFRQQTLAGSSSGRSSSGSSSSSGTRSLRNILQGMRRSGPSTSSNIARVSDTIPRAMPPMLPPTKRFGELNIPSVIEAALRRLQERARLQGNVRDNNVLPRQRMPPKRAPTHTPDRSPFSGGVIDLSRLSINERNNRVNGTTGVNSGASGSNSNPRWDIGTVLSTSTLGRNGVSPLGSPWQKSPSGMNTNEIRQNVNGPYLKNNDLLQMPKDNRSLPSSSVGRTGSNLRTFQDKTLERALPANRGSSVQPKLDVQNLLSNRWASQNSFTPARNSKDVRNGPTLVARGGSAGSNAFQTNPPQYPNQPPKGKFDVPAPSRIADFNSPTQSSKSKSARPNPPNTGISAPAAAVSLNASAKVSSSSAEANSTRNQTTTKSVKTKTIKVTTVVKGGTKADVKAAAASQADIARSVAQGKQISGPALEKLAKSAAGVAKTSSASGTNPPAGSITVSRQPNGDSIITLSDGQGEPVVLRSSGPVKIERIIKPNGRVQFLINPVENRQTTIDPAVAAEMEIEPEDITTTVQTPIPASVSVVGFTDAPWTTNPPLYPDSSFNNGPASKSPVGGTTKIEKTVQITDTAVADTASTSFNTSVKNSTASASLKRNGLMQLFKPPNIPRPPKVSDMNFGNVGIGNPFVANNQKFMSDPHTIKVPTPSNIPTHINISSTVSPIIPTDRSIQPSDIFPSSTNLNQQKHTDVMPQYSLLGVSPSVTFQGKPLP